MMRQKVTKSKVCVYKKKQKKLATDGILKKT